MGNGPAGSYNVRVNAYSVVIATVVGKRRKCKACGAVQVVHHPHDARYHCKKCGHAFTRAELLPSKKA